MAIDLYHMDLSPPSRSVRLVAAIIGVDLNLKVIDLMAEEHLTPEFGKINPQRAVPTLVDGDFVLNESRTICRYLVNQYTPGHSLYPACPKKRALVDKYLDFDLGTFYKAIEDYYFAALFEGKEFNPKQEKKLKKALKHLQSFLGDQEFLLGKEISIADICIASGWTIPQCARYELQEFPKLDAWIKRINALPQWVEICSEPVKKFAEMFVDKKQG